MILNYNTTAEESQEKNEKRKFMKIKVYGYYNYDNIHDQKEHLTVTPLCDVETDRRHDFSGNVYEFEYTGKMQLEYSKYFDKDLECELDQFLNKSSKLLIQVNPDKFGYVHWCVVSKNGCC